MSELGIDAEHMLAGYVQTERERRGWSQRELAERLSEFGMPIHPTGITRLERGERGVSLNEFVAICDVFGETVSTVFHTLHTTHDVSRGIEEQLDRMEKSPPSLLETVEVVETLLDLMKGMLGDAANNHRKQSPPLIRLAGIHDTAVVEGLVRAGQTPFLADLGGLDTDDTDRFLDWFISFAPKAAGKIASLRGTNPALILVGAPRPGTESADGWAELGRHPESGAELRYNPATGGLQSVPPEKDAD